VQQFCIHVSSGTAEVCVFADISTFKSVKEHKWGLRVEMNHTFENCVKPPFIMRRRMNSCEWDVVALEYFITMWVTFQIQFELVSQIAASTTLARRGVK